MMHPSRVVFRKPGGGRRLRPVIATASLCAALLAICMLWIDRPVETLVAGHVFSNGSPLLMFFDAMALPSLLPMPCAVLYLAVYGLRNLSGPPAWPRAALGLRLALVTAVATLAKDELKWLCGRPWPSTWVHYGAYAFAPFQSNTLYGSFPSGHTTYIAAPMLLLCHRLPRYRLLWLGCIVSVMIGLVGSGHHFVADVIAGFFVGLAAAAGIETVWPGEAFPPISAPPSRSAPRGGHG